MNEQDFEVHVCPQTEQMLKYLEASLFDEAGKARDEIPKPNPNIWGIEGSDGSGKSTMETPLQRCLESRGHTVQIIPRNFPRNSIFDVITKGKPYFNNAKDTIFRAILRKNIAIALGYTHNMDENSPMAIMQNSIVRQLAYIISKAEDYDIEVLNPYITMLYQYGPLIGNILYVKVDPQIAFQRIKWRGAPGHGDPQTPEEAKRRAYVYDRVLKIMENLGVNIYTVNNNEDLSSCPDINQALQDKLSNAI